MPVYNRTVDTRTSPKAGLRHTKSDTMQRKLDTEGWQKNAEMLADDAFADEAIVQQEVGTIRRKSTTVETCLWHYEI